MSIRSDISEYTSGKITAEQLAQKWKGRKWVAPHPRRRSIVDVELEAEDVGTTPGSWDEVKVLWITGGMTDKQYFALSEAVQKMAGRLPGPTTSDIR